jgi:hypothetical protein
VSTFLGKILRRRPEASTVRSRRRLTPVRLGKNPGEAASNSSRIGSDGKTLQDSLSDEDIGCGLAMQHMLQKKRFLSNI